MGKEIEEIRERAGVESLATYGEVKKAVGENRVLGVAKLEGGETDWGYQLAKCASQHGLVPKFSKSGVTATAEFVPATPEDDHEPAFFTFAGAECDKI